MTSYRHFHIDTKEVGKEAIGRLRCQVRSCDAFVPVSFFRVSWSMLCGSCERRWVALLDERRDAGLAGPFLASS